MAEFTFEGREVIKKEVREVGTGAHVLVPKDWLGETVAVVRLEADDDTTSDYDTSDPDE